MFFRPRFLSILTTRRCTAECDHCCVGASPWATQAIPVERIRRLIDEATDVPSLELIGFTGGECFLLGRELDELVRRVTSYGLRSRAITNGYWAVTEGAARDRIAALRNAGLSEIMFSTGTFHQRFVPFKRVLNGVRAAAEAGIRTRLAVEVFDQSSFEVATAEAQLSDLVAEGKVVIGCDPWTSDAEGRGTAPVSHDRLLARDPGHANGRCDQIFNVISVTPAQELIACCGFPQEALPRLRFGSVANRPLREVLDSAVPELFKMWLHVAGPVEIARFVTHYVPDFRLPACATICEACVALQRNKIAMNVVAEHGADIAEQVSLQFALLQSA